MKVPSFFALVLGLIAATGSTAQPAPPHIVFVTGDEEYRSEESMPMLARILERDYGFRATVRFALDDEGMVDPNVLNNIPGLEALEDADMMVLFTRFRALPDEQLHHILSFAESGRPMAGFRTATHAFLYMEDSTRARYNDDWPQQVFGQHWITHHGHFADGDAPLTDVALIEGQQDHPILRGIEPFRAFSWLYHVHGGDHELYGDSAPLLMGTSLRSNHADNNQLDQFPLSNPVAWTKTYSGSSGEAARVFFTTLGHPYDFRETSMRRLALNGILWALGHPIPEGGAETEFVGLYEPNNSGFGERFKPGLRPSDF